MLYLTPFITVYLCALAVVAGLCMGSFLNCLAIRLVNGESIAKGRSHCMKCGHVLGFKDLIPVVSFLCLKGKCRYCGEKMSPRYLISELISGVVFLLLLLKYDVSVEFVKFLLLACVLLCISFADLESYIIPDCLIIAGLVIRVVFILTEGNIAKDALTALIGGLSISLPVLIIVLVAEKILKKEAMGGGDIKLLFMAGTFFDWKVNILALIAACFAGIVAGSISKNKEEGKLIPFGPAISFGYFFAMLCGKEIISAYLSLF